MIIQVYAPTTNVEDEIEMLFNESIKDEIDQTPKQDTTIQ